MTASQSRWQLSLVETLAAEYQKNIEKVLRRKAAQYERLAEKDPFEMSDDQQQWHRLRLLQLEEDIFLLNECLTMSAQFREAWAAQSEMPSPPDNGFLNWSWEQYRRVREEAVFWRQTALQEMDKSLEMLNIFQNSFEKLKKAA